MPPTDPTDGEDTGGQPDTTVAITSKFNRTMAYVVWAGCVVGLVVSVVSFGAPSPDLLVPLAFVAFASWAAFWRPYLVITPREIHVRNVTHSVTIPWASLIDVQTRFGLTLLTPGHRFGVWVAPSPGQQTVRYRNLRRRGRDGEDLGPVAAQPLIPLGESAAYDSGRAVRAIRERWQALIDADRLEIGAAQDVRRRWDWPVLVALAAGLAVSWWLLATV